MYHKNDCAVYSGGKCATPVACASQPTPEPASGVPSVDVPPTAFYMSLRDYFAGQWLSTFQIVSGKGPLTPQEVARRSYLYADAMMAARK